MDKKVAIVSVIIVLLIGAGGYYLLSQEDGVDMQSTTTQQTTPATQEEAEATTEETATPGVYVDYSEDYLANTSGARLLFFHAPWCPQCRALENDIESKGVPDGVTIVKVDYDSSQDLRQKYGVTLQTTVVRVDDEGNLVSKYVAYDDPSLESVRANLL